MSRDKNGPQRLPETYVTRTTAEIAREDESFAIALARALLETASERPATSVQSTRAVSMLSHVPTTGLELRAERTIPRDSLWAILWDLYDRDRIDWLFIDDSFALAVEVKTQSTTRFGDRQLARYHKAIKALKRPYVGLLALTTVRPFDYELLARRKRFFVGSILWADAEARLRLVVPSEPQAAARWGAILDDVLTP